MSRVWTLAALAAITLLSWFWFPGHTWLHQDSQIYAAILEHQWDPGVLTRDILVQQPHVSFTLYDELTNLLRFLTRASLRDTLAGEQFAFRFLGFVGIYLTALSLRLPKPLALLVMAICSLGATIVGPAVLTVEYEPTPRAFAVPLVFLGIGLLALNRPVLAGTAGAFAFVLHAPAALPFWGVLLLAAIFLRDPRLWRAFLPLAAGLALLTAAAVVQSGGEEHQQFFARIPAEIERLQRLRASYNWVSLWASTYLKQYVVLWLLSCAALWQIRARVVPFLRWFLVILPVLGLLSVPLSWLLLEQAKWSLIPQLQPARALLFLTWAAQLTLAAAACDAVLKRKYLRAWVWFAIALYTAAAAPWLVSPGTVVIATVLGLACLSVIAASLFRRFPAWGFAPLAIAVLSLYPGLVWVAGIRNYPVLRTPQLEELASWASRETGRDAVFLFPGAGHSTVPGIFRAESLRALYVDWKGGGQVNYLPQLGREWWARWERTGAGLLLRQPLGYYRDLGIDYVVLTGPAGAAVPAFRNAGFAVYSTKAYGFSGSNAR